MHPSLNHGSREHNMPDGITATGTFAICEQIDQPDGF